MVTFRKSSTCRASGAPPAGRDYSKGECHIGSMNKTSNQATRQCPKGRNNTCRPGFGFVRGSQLQELCHRAARGAGGAVPVMMIRTAPPRRSLTLENTSLSKKGDACSHRVPSESSSAHADETPSSGCMYSRRSNVVRYALQARCRPAESSQLQQDLSCSRWQQCTLVEGTPDSR